MSDFDNYVNTFRQEAAELLTDIEDCILIIETNPDDIDTVNRLFRAMHTIKGSGAMFGFAEVASFTHHVETVLDKVREGVVPVSRTLIDLILDSKDQISALMDAVSAGTSVDQARSDQIVAGLNALLPGAEAKSDQPDSAQAPLRHAEALEARAAYRIKFCPQPNLFASGSDPLLLLDELRDLGECEIFAQTDHLPTIENLNPEECHISWEIVLSTDKGENSINDVFIFVEDICQIEITNIADKFSVQPEMPLPRLGEILAERGDVPSEMVMEALQNKPRIGEILVEAGVVSRDNVDAALSEQKAMEKLQSAAKNESVRVPSDKLDALINLVGELVITQAQLAQVAMSLDLTELAAPVEEVERLTDELRDIVLNIRMMPIGTTFSRFKRLVRDMSAELGKEIDLETEGAETEMDKTVIDRLGDPLVHLIRNSIDHGIEMPDGRLENGKPRKGTIRLIAAHRGASIVITIEDDGKGLNAELIRKKGIEKGLISADADLSEEEIFSLIFAPGFSLAATVTNVSGRGVGMDVVRREIDSLRGHINISSKKGQGTVIDLSLPLTLAIIEGLLVDVGEERFVIPLSMVEECLELTDDRYALSQDRNVIQMRGEAVPFVRLREAFEISGDIPGREETVVVSSNDNRLGIVVDRVVGHHQTVIKSLGSAYKDVEAVSGATILGDGKVALILDIIGLLKLANTEEQKIASLRRLSEAA
ncbi:MAG: chemotaxis protein CheA [Armatimonadetes bacterium]|nr:chemotaxis protein CheA [Armatimonadota bacterium]